MRYPVAVRFNVISLYDTLTRRVQPLRLRRPGEVSMYVCGPTVYDYPHLGHARSALTYDVLRRYLSWRGLAVRHVANVTDIDDKIIARANREGLTEREVATRWEAVYVKAMAALGVLAPHERPRATGWVKEMIRFVEGLHAAERAYTTKSGVYLRVCKVPGYGDLVCRSLDELRTTAGSRVQVDSTKEDPLDFALWKAAKPGEPTWDSPWGPGRPGWHIECTAMSLGLFGDGFDLHGGGDDLVFPHHTNERAQALAAGRSFARHWMHNAMLNVDGDKMSKSQGNFRTVADLLNEHPGNGRALRLLVLQTHYRKSMEVNADLMAAARAAVGRLDAMVRRAVIAGVMAFGDSDGGVDDNAGVDERGGVDDGAVVDGRYGRWSVPSALTDTVDAFRAAMDHDMGTPEATAIIFETLRRANLALDAGGRDAAALVHTVVELAGVLGIETSQARLGSSVGISGSGASGPSAEPDVGGKDNDNTRIESLVLQRQDARQARDWETADAIRDELTALGVVVEDTPGGSVWHRRE